MVYHNKHLEPAGHHLPATDTDVETAADHDGGWDQGPQQEPHHGSVRGVVNHHKVRVLGVMVAIKRNPIQR